MTISSNWTTVELCRRLLSNDLPGVPPLDKKADKKKRWWSFWKRSA